jgi:hypothetical protein
MSGNEIIVKIIKINASNSIIKSSKLNKCRPITYCRNNSYMINYFKAPVEIDKNLTEKILEFIYGIHSNSWKIYVKSAYKVFPYIKLSYQSPKFKEKLRNLK